jgi:hypothetical protein
MFLIGGCLGTTLPWSLIGSLEMANCKWQMVYMSVCTCFASMALLPRSFRHEASKILLGHCVPCNRHRCLIPYRSFASWHLSRTLLTRVSNCSSRTVYETYTDFVHQPLGLIKIYFWASNLPRSLYASLPLSLFRMRLRHITMPRSMGLIAKVMDRTQTPWLRPIGRRWEKTACTSIS